MQLPLIRFGGIADPDIDESAQNPRLKAALASPEADETPESPEEVHPPLCCFADSVHDEGPLQILGNSKTQKPEGVHGRHGVAGGVDAVLLQLTAFYWGAMMSSLMSFFPCEALACRVGSPVHYLVNSAGHQQEFPG